MSPKLITFLALALPCLALPTEPVTARDVTTGYDSIPAGTLEFPHADLEARWADPEDGEVIGDFVLVGDTLKPLRRDLELNTFDHSNSTLEVRQNKGYYGFICKPIRNGNRASCYVEKHTSKLYGWQQALSTITSCSVAAGCSTDRAYTYSATQSFSINVGLNGDLTWAKDAFKSVATIGASWSWTTTQGTGTTTRFNMQEGDSGAVVYWPLLHKSCGDLAVTTTGCYRGECIIDPWTGAPGQVNTADACGMTSVMLTTGEPNGVVGFCITDGPRKGKGCAHPALPPDMA